MACQLRASCAPPGAWAALRLESSLHAKFSALCWLLARHGFLLTAFLAGRRDLVNRHPTHCDYTPAAFGSSLMAALNEGASVSPVGQGGGTRSAIPPATQNASEVTRLQWLVKVRPPPGYPSRTAGADTHL